MTTSEFVLPVAKERPYVGLCKILAVKMWCYTMFVPTDYILGHFLLKKKNISSSMEKAQLKYFHLLLKAIDVCM